MFEGVAPPPDQFHKFTPNPSSSPSPSPSPHLPLHLSFTSSSSTPPIFPISFDPYHHHNHQHHHHQHQHQHQVLPPPASPSILPNFFHPLNFNPHTHTAGASTTTTRSIIKNSNHHEHKELVEAAASIIQQDPAAWSNEEVLSLLRIRSTMELNWFPSADYTWEHVSRKLSEVGFKRSAEKCKEKFEEESRYINTINNSNHHNYHDRAFSSHDDLVNHLHNHDATDDVSCHPELYHNNDNANNKTNHEDDGDGHEHLAKQVEEQKDKIDDHHDDDDDQDHTAASGDTDHTTADDNDDDGDPIMNQFQNPSSSSNGNNITKSINNDDNHHLQQQQQNSKKREKRKREEDKFEMFKGFCQDVVDKMMAQQEEMQNKLIEDMIQRDQDKLAREEAWKQQEIDRINQDLQLRSDQQSLAGDRQSSFLKFLENLPATTTAIPQQLVDHYHHNLPKAPIMNNNNIGYPIPTSSSSSSAASQPNPKQHTESQSQETAGLQNHPIQSEFKSIQKDGINPQSNNPPNPSEKPVVVGELENRQKEEVGKRWPRDEVLALINLRCGIHNNGGGRNEAEKEGGSTSNKAPLWERISRGMLELGYRRSAKRCKEKWENINKYFRKTKDQNKKRSLDSRTCPYFHQLSSLYGGNAATAAATEEAGAIPEVLPYHRPGGGDLTN